MSQSQEKSFALLVEALGKAAGVPDVAPASDGIFRMELGERLLSIVQQGDSAILYCALGTLPENERRAKEIRIALLSANVLYQGTYGACLGATPEDGIIALCFQTPMSSVTEEGFVRLVENFVNLADVWEARLAEILSREQQAFPEIGDVAQDAAPIADPLMRA